MRPDRLCLSGANEGEPAQTGALVRDPTNERIIPSGGLSRLPGGTPLLVTTSPRVSSVLDRVTLGIVWRILLQPEWQQEEHAVRRRHRVGPLSEYLDAFAHKL